MNREIVQVLNGAVEAESIRKYGCRKTVKTDVMPNINVVTKVGQTHGIIT